LGPDTPGQAVIEPVTAFGLERHDGPYSSWPDKTRLFFEDRDTGRTLTGYVLEAQFRVDDCYLLVTSDDCPFEEFTRFYLLDERFGILSHTCQGWLYASWMLKSISPEAARSFRVDFHGDEGWRLTVRERRWWRFGRLLSLRRTT
jgi:hypothetical protein